MFVCSVAHSSARQCLRKVGYQRAAKSYRSAKWFFPHATLQSLRPLGGLFSARQFVLRGGAPLVLTCVVPATSALAKLAEGVRSARFGAVNEVDVMSDAVFEIETAGWRRFVHGRDKRGVLCQVCCSYCDSSLDDISQNVSSQTDTRSNDGDGTPLVLVHRAVLRWHGGFMMWGSDFIWPDMNALLDTCAKNGELNIDAVLPVDKQLSNRSQRRASLDDGKKE